MYHMNTPKTSIQQNENNNSTFNEQTESANELKYSQNFTDELLAGITKRVVFNENRFKISETLTSLKSFMINEKCHLIDQNELNNMDDQNFKFANFKQNRRSKEEEYNKLLQCLSRKLLRKLGILF